MRALPILGLLISFLLVKFSQQPELLQKPVIIGYSPVGQDGAVGLLGLTTLIGGLIVFLFYWFKFNEWAGSGEAPSGFRPRPARHFTTWIRFLGWNSFYALLMVICYSVIVFFPEFVFRLVDSFVGAAGMTNTPLPGMEDMRSLFQEFLYQGRSTTSATPPQPDEIAPFAVMLTTVVWAGMRPFAEFEKRFRHRLQENAAIPTQAKELIKTFAKVGNFVPEEAIVNNVVEGLRGNQLQAEDFEDKGNSLWFLYARIKYLQYLLSEYKTAPVLSRLAERYDYEFRDLEINIEQLKNQAKQRIADIEQFAEDLKLLGSGSSEQSASKHGDELSANPTLKLAEQWLAKNLLKADKFREDHLTKQKDELRKTLESVSNDIIQLIVCGVLAVGRSPAQRWDMLEAFGLTDHEKKNIQMDAATLTWVAGITLSVVFTCSLIYYGLAQYLGIPDKLSGSLMGEMIPQDITKVLGWSIMACLMHLLATASGYLYQRCLETNRERLRIGKQRPLRTMAQIAEAIWAAVIGFSVNVILIGAFIAMDNKFAMLGSFWWWALVPAVTAFFTALYSQKVERKEAQRSKLLWCQGTVTGLTATIVFILLYTTHFWSGTGQTIDGINLGAILVMGLYISITTTMLGTALGYILNLWVIAEKYAKQSNQRSDPRRFLLFNKGKWKTESNALPVRAMSLSSSGAEIKSNKPLMLDSEGDLKLPTLKTRRARVIRLDPEDRYRSFVKFIESEAT